MSTTNESLNISRSLISRKSSISHCMKSVHIWSFSGPYFPAFWLNTESTEYLSVFSPNAGKCEPKKRQIRIFFTQCQMFKWVLNTPLLPFFCRKSFCKLRNWFINRSNHVEVFYKKFALTKDYLKLTENQLCWSFFFNKVTNFLRATSS